MNTRSPSIRALRTAAAVVAGALAITGCASAAGSAGGATADDRIVVALTGEPSSLNPLYDTNLPALNVFYQVFDQLTTIDATGAVVPALAESWTADETQTEWVFSLRDDATFQDGSPVTAEDVTFTYETAMADPESKLGGYMTRIDTIEATGEHEVTFSLNTPYAPFDRQATLVPIVPKAIYEADPEGFATAPVGSGPYELESWKRGDSITLVRNDDYFGDTGTVKTVELRFVLDETTRANSLQSGDLDIALLGPSQIASVRASGSVDVVDQQSNRVIYAGFNATAAWLDDATFRAALDMAIDREAISDKLMNGVVEPAAQLVAPATFGFDADLEPTAYDPEQARVLIEASGYDGEAITLSYPTTGLPQIDQLAQAVGGYLEAVGVTVRLDPQEAGTFINAWFGAELSGIYLFAFAPSVMDADLPLTMLAMTGGQGYFSDAEIDSLLTAQLAQSDLAKRAEQLASVSRLIAEHTYYAPLFVDTYTYGSTKGLDWTPRPDGFFIFN